MSKAAAQAGTTGAEEVAEFNDTKAWSGDYDPAVIDIRAIEAGLGKIAKRLLKPKKPEV